MTEPFDQSLIEGEALTIPGTIGQVISPAMEAKLYAEAEYFRAKTLGQEVDNATARALSQSADIALSREIIKNEWDAASNGRNRVYHFTDVVKEDTVEQAVDVLNRWQRLDGDNENPWRFVICSGGGNVVAGMKLYSTIKALSTKREITTIASGLCASMATVIHQAGTVRIVEPGCSYMIHDVSAEVAGKLTDMQDTMEWLVKLNSMLHEALAEKSALTVEEIAALSKRRDSWHMPEAVVEMGFADKIGFAIE